MSGSSWSLAISVCVPVCVGVSMLISSLTVSKFASLSVWTVPRWFPLGDCLPNGLISIFPYFLLVLYVVKIGVQFILRVLEYHQNDWHPKASYKPQNPRNYREFEISKKVQNPLEGNIWTILKYILIARVWPENQLRNLLTPSALAF